MNKERSDSKTQVGTSNHIRKIVAPKSNEDIMNLRGFDTFMKKVLKNYISNNISGNIYCQENISSLTKILGRPEGNIEPGEILDIFMNLVNDIRCGNFVNLELFYFLVKDDEFLRLLGQEFNKITNIEGETAAEIISFTKNFGCVLDNKLQGNPMIADCSKFIEYLKERIMANNLKIVIQASTSNIIELFDPDNQTALKSAEGSPDPDQPSDQSNALASYPGYRIIKEGKNFALVEVKNNDQTKWFTVSKSTLQTEEIDQGLSLNQINIELPENIAIISRLGNLAFFDLTTGQLGVYPKGYKGCNTGNYDKLQADSRNIMRLNDDKPILVLHEYNKNTILIDLKSFTCEGEVCGLYNPELSTFENSAGKFKILLGRSGALIYKENQLIKDDSDSFASLTTKLVDGETFVLLSNRNGTFSIYYDRLYSGFPEKPELKKRDGKIIATWETREPKKFLGYLRNPDIVNNEIIIKK